MVSWSFTTYSSVKSLTIVACLSIWPEFDPGWACARESLRVHQTQVWAPAIVSTTAIDSWQERDLIYNIVFSFTYQCYVVRNTGQFRVETTSKLTKTIRNLTILGTPYHSDAVLNRNQMYSCTVGCVTFLSHKQNSNLKWHNNVQSWKQPRVYSHQAKVGAKAKKIRQSKPIKEEMTNVTDVFRFYFRFRSVWMFFNFTNQHCLSAPHECPWVRTGSPPPCPALTRRPCWPCARSASASPSSTGSYRPPSSRTGVAPTSPRFAYTARSNPHIQ